MRVLIGCNETIAESMEMARDISRMLENSGITPCVWNIGGDIPAKTVSSPAECTHIVTIGGDGTILRWGKTAAEYDIPLLGVNMGRLGFMATLERSETEKIPRLLTEGNISRRMLMDCAVIRADGSRHVKPVLNDVVIARESGSKLPEFRVFCGGAEVIRLRADGVIMSTPTGSTAYSLSAGGPILSPELECIEFTALCPHTLFNRPMIFSAQQEVAVSVRGYQGSRVTAVIDGENDLSFGEGDEIRLTRSAKTLRLIEAGGGFYGSVHSKLMQPLK